MFGLSILDRYIAKNVLFIVFLSAIVLTTLTGIIALIDQTRHLGRGNIDFVFLVWYIILRMPADFVTMFPVAILLGGVIGLGMMAKHSELVIMQSSGMSRASIILRACKSIIPIVILVSLCDQTIVPRISQYAESQFNFHLSEGRVSRTSSGVWLREGNSFISIRAVLSDNSIHNVTRYEFDGTNLVSIAVAVSGTYDNGKWDMRDVNHLNFQEKSITSTNVPLEKWDLYLNPERLEIFGIKTSSLNVPELLDYIHYLEANNIDSSRYRLALYKKFVQPLAMVVMLLLGAANIFGSLRSINMSFRIVTGLGIGFLFYMSNEVIPSFILVIGISPLIGVFIPSILFMGLAIYFLNRKQ